ncbi:hypothetical protein GCM10022378_00850 [Salinicoccus jeotgali]|uniref:Bifunctional metallophosphatase/5'-nucleotidase n=1 Tax=Salinicoccus jeotgali TaxID=381634 RepID=A0ABP7E5Z5_9STAP
MKLTIFATSDVHGAIYPHDYFNDTYKSKSLLHLKSFMDAHRLKHPDDIVMTVDNGDFLQGDVWNDYDYRHSDDPLLAIEVMNDIYDVIGLGNHEFNFGLDYLLKAYRQVEAEIVNANVDFHQHALGDIIKRYVIVDKQTPQGLLRVGFLNVVPTQIMKWDAFHLEGRVEVEDMNRTVRHTAREMKEAGADIVILMSHSGMSKDPDHIRLYGENQTFLMTMVEDVDGIIFGHTHEFFPDRNFEARIDAIDFKRGAVNGKPMVQPGVSASHLGCIEFDLGVDDDGAWEIKNSRAHLIESESLTPTRETLSKYEDSHRKVLDYLSEPIGHIDETWHTYFSRIIPSKAVQAVAEASKAYAETLISRSDLERLPVLGFNAVTKAGRDGPHDFTVLAEGELTLSAAIDLYKHTNSMVIIKIDGGILKEWLEWSASQFNQVDENEDLLKANSSKNGFPSYNFDTFFDLEYTFDISRPARYSGTAKKISDSERVTEMKYQGKDIQPGDSFIVPANNYRVAYTPFLRDAEVLHESQRTVRDIVIEYMMTNPYFDHKKPMTIIPGGTYMFKTATRAKAYIDEQAVRHVEELGNGFSWYEIDLKEDKYGTSDKE